MEAENGPPEGRGRRSYQAVATVGSAKRGLGANYFAYVSDNQRNELGVSGQVVVARTFDDGSSPEDPEQREAHPPQMRARCQIAQSEWKPRDHEVRLDQTLRNALGIGVRPKSTDTVEIYDLKLSWARILGERFWDRILRRRYLFMRVRKADPSDMEKRMVRIPSDSFRLLGINSGEKLSISHPAPAEDDGNGPFEERRCTLQAYPVTSAIEDRYRDSTGGLYDRFPNSAKLLAVDPDLGSIYLDQSAREKLDVRTLEVVRVRRSDPDAFMQQFRSFGLAAAAAAITVSGVFGLGENFHEGAIVIVIAFAMAVGFSIFNLRANSYGSAG